MSAHTRLETTMTASACSHGSRLCRRILIGSLCWLMLFAGKEAAAFTLPHTYKVGPNITTCDFTTIQAAIDAASATAGDIIVLGNGLTYTEHLTITGKSLTIQGGASCLFGGAPPATTTSAQATISGNSGASSAVLTITGASNVTLIGLEITGNQSSGSGGGIEYAGTGILTLTNVLVTANTAYKCGGIDFEGPDTSPGTSVELVLGTNTQITSNTAQTDGGGVCVSGVFSTLRMESSGTSVASNSAPNGNGGGIAIFGADADFDAPDANGAPQIYQNTAKDGGGIAIISTTPYGYSPQVILGTSGAYPVRIEGNRATDPAGGGGGVYMLPNSINAAYVYTNATRIDGNFAVEGSAIYAGCAIAPPCLPAQVIFQKTACMALECNTIDGNTAQTMAGQPTLGSAIFLRYSAFLASGLRMRGNIGAHVVRTANQTAVFLSDCLLAENILASEPFIMSSGILNVDQCTFANDTIGEPPVIYTDNANVSLTNSILGEDVAALLATGGSVTAQKIVAKNTSGLPTSPSIVQADPLFFDIAHSDYRLRVQTDGVTLVASPAVDFAPATTGNDHADINGRPRDVDVALVADQFGPRDLGAYEMQPISDRVFADGFGDPVMLVY